MAERRKFLFVFSVGRLNQNSKFHATIYKLKQNKAPTKNRKPFSLKKILHCDKYWDLVEDQDGISYRKAQRCLYFSSGATLKTFLRGKGEVKYTLTDSIFVESVQVTTAVNFYPYRAFTMAFSTRRTSLTAMWQPCWKRSGQPNG